MSVILINCGAVPCTNPISAAAEHWPYWASHPITSDAIATCSDACRTRLQAEMDTEVSRMTNLPPPAPGSQQDSMSQVILYQAAMMAALKREDRPIGAIIRVKGDPTERFYWLRWEFREGEGVWLAWPFGAEPIVLQDHAQIEVAISPANMASRFLAYLHVFGPLDEEEGEAFGPDPEVHHNRAQRSAAQERSGIEKGMAVNLIRLNPGLMPEQKGMALRDLDLVGRPDGPTTFESVLRSYEVQADVGPPYLPPVSLLKGFASCFCPHCRVLRAQNLVPNNPDDPLYGHRYDWGTGTIISVMSRIAVLTRTFGCKEQGYRFPFLGLAEDWSVLVDDPGLAPERSVPDGHFRILTCEEAMQSWEGAAEQVEPTDAEYERRYNEMAEAVVLGCDPLEEDLEEDVPDQIEETE